MPTLQWRKADPDEHGDAETTRLVATHGTTTLRVWRSVDVGQWGWAIVEQTASGEQTETSAAATRAQAQTDAEARARDRRLIP